MKKKSFGIKRAPMTGEMELQITSMADIFTILLVFLLKSYATGAVNLTPAKNMLLPSAHAAEVTVEALKIEITERAIQVEGNPVAELQRFALDPADKMSNGSSRKLSEALEKQRKRQLLIAQANPDVKVDPKILIVADQRAPYSTIKAVLASAAVHGYTDFKMAVVQEK